MDWRSEWELNSYNNQLKNNEIISTHQILVTYLVTFFHYHPGNRLLFKQLHCISTLGYFSRLGGSKIAFTSNLLKLELVRWAKNFAHL